MKLSAFFQTLVAAALLSASVLFFQPHSARAADHGDAPATSNDQAADLADVYFFLDPNDNTKAVLLMTVRGFIVPGEAVNFGIFDPNVHYRFDIENTGDAANDAHYDITFSPRTAIAGPSPRPILQIPQAQTATIRLPGGTSFTAPVVNPSVGATPPPQTVTTDSASGISFFAGEVDDPFFFDLPAFSRFVASIRNGAPDVSQLTRGRDTFAGYNVMGIALRIPVAAIKGAGNIIGVDADTLRPAQIVVKKNGKKPGVGALAQVDRAGNPAVNVALIPFNRKDEYNGNTTTDDAAGKFSADIIATLTALGTNQANINILAGIAITKGDFLHLDVTKANVGTQGGSGSNGFPNGRRLTDDVIDTLLNIITNGGVTTGDNVNANDVTFGDTFPFFAPSQQPLATGTVDDNTRN